MKSYRWYNNLCGWAMFLFAALVYLKTMSPAASFWDCGEFIASSFKLQVGHQPGAPLYIILGKVFSMLASDEKQVAFWVNIISALASAATIMFLYWTITALAFKLIKTKTAELQTSQMLVIICAGIIGAMAYAFSDSFWFSAAEAEVYALSSLCTAVVFWAALKWDADTSEFANRWLVLIAYIIGLSIGIHLLNLLAIPAIVLLYYFKMSPQTHAKGILLAMLTGFLLVGFVQNGIIQYLVYFASRFDIFFVNSLHLAFGAGALFFAVLIASSIAWGITYSIRKHKPFLNLALVCLSFILLGYTSYAMIIVRANAKTTINISNPDSVVSLLGYLGRDQYGDRPLTYGQYFDSKLSGYEQGETLYRKGSSAYEAAGVKSTARYDRNTLLPRIYSQKPEHQQLYRNWLGLPETQSPSFTDNLRFLTTYQLGHMYWRYFLWNFSGKQNDEQGYGEINQGNWISGIKPLDALRLGNQSKLPASITANEAYNRFYGLPLLLGFAGLLYHLRKSRKQAGVVALLFFCTGIAIILYLNQGPAEPRERDYAFVASFYAFSIWIGLGFIAIRAFIARLRVQKFATGLAFILCMAAVPALMGLQGWDDHDRSTRYLARDMAANYLKSCAPNAILFTNADNDTYPLWYAQQVEGVRPDVRIVNLQLLYNDSYINQMKERLFDSEPLPISLNKEKYVQGVRDYIPHVDYDFKDSVELKDVVGVMTSDNPADKVDMQDGSKENFLPTKKLKITVNPNLVIKSGTIPEHNRTQITGKIEWTYNKDYVTRADLAVFDILANNNWQRPVYFTANLSADSYYGLDRYLYSEGYAYRLLPLKREENDKRPKEELVNTAALYHNLVNNYELSSFKKEKYLEPEARRIANATWDSFNTLAADLYAKGQTEYSKKTMDKALQTLPLRNYSTADTIDKYRAAANLYNLKDITRANVLLSSAATFLDSELSYYASLNEHEQVYFNAIIMRNLAVLNAVKTLAEEHKQVTVSKHTHAIFEKLNGKLILPGQG